MKKADYLNIKKVYESLSDDELIFKIQNDSAGLLPEVIELIKNEVNQRGLDSQLLIELAWYNRTATVEEIETLGLHISQFCCPICNENERPINGTETHHVMSFVFVTYSRKYRYLGCSRCLVKKNMLALIATLIFGWWGFPWGVLKTPVYIVRNLIDLRRALKDEPNKHIESFIAENISSIEDNFETAQELQEYLNRSNPIDDPLAELW